MKIVKKHENHWVKKLVNHQSHPQNVHFSGKATTDLLTTLADVEATEAVEELLPRVSQWPGIFQPEKSGLHQVFPGT